MELEKQKNISRVIHNTLKRFEDFPKDSFEIKSIDLKYVLEYAVFLEKELEHLQKNSISKDKIKELIIKKKQQIQENNKQMDECRKTIMEEQELKKIQLYTLTKSNNLLELEIASLLDLLKEE